jgi:hypothetical protein
VIRRRGPSATVTRALLGVLIVLVAVGVVVLSRNGRPPTATTGATGSSSTPSATGTPGPALTPTADWHTVSPKGTSIEGFASRTSVLPGGTVDLRVSATAPSFSVSAFRMGSYGAEQAALAWKGGPFPTVAQPAAVELPGTRTITAPWKPTATVAATDWQPGAYLLRL